jgi:ABC-type Fe3+-hydroxamate transport system substrate-binding protein
VRVVSLVPSVTETLLAWGVDVLACTRFCEQPDLRHVGGTKDPDIGAIAALAPDVVVLDREENRREDADALVAAGCTIHVTAVRALADVDPTLDALADATDATVAAKRTPMDGVSGGDAVPDVAVEDLPPSASARSAFVAIWRRPWMTISADTYGSSLLASIGVDNVYADHPDRYPTVDLVDVAERRPGLVVLPSEPYPFAERHLPGVSAALPDSLPVLVDGRDLFWWGVRTPGARRRLAAQLGGLGSP